MDYLKLEQIKDDFRTFLRATGKEIYRLLQDERVKDRFVEQIERFMSMRETHKVEFNKLVEQAKRLKKDIKAPEDLPPDPLGWYKIPTYSPSSNGACNLYGVIFPASYEQKKPTAQELLMLYCVILGVIYDLAYARTLGLPKLYFDVDQIQNTRPSEWTIREDVAVDVWRILTAYGLESTFPRTWQDANAIEKEYIENALDAVKVDLAAKEEAKRESHAKTFGFHSKSSSE